MGVFKYFFPQLHFSVNHDFIKGVTDVSFGERSMKHYEFTQPIFF